MTLLSVYSDVTDHRSKIQSVIQHRKQLEILTYWTADEKWNTLEDLREEVLDNNGQFISLDLADLGDDTLPEAFYAALKHARLEASLQFSLPSILQHNPHRSPFINRAILWQKLCDQIIAEEEKRRTTVLVLENFDQATPRVRHDAARLIRFHETMRINRTFLVTLHQNNAYLTEELGDRPCRREPT